MARILVVEDNPANLKLAVFLLESAGHEVISATNAEAGLALAREKSPNLILMDIQLPGMDGLEATGILMGDVATRGIPVIAVNENKTVLNVNFADLGWQGEHLYTVENYWEAAGLLQALKQGIDPKLLRRPLEGPFRPIAES